MSSELALPGKLVNRILTHMQQHKHKEACGLISASGNRPKRYYAVQNIARDPSTQFEMDPQPQIAAMKHMREHEEKLFAIVHSHPQSPPVPSALDMHDAGYADAYYIIVSLNTRGVLEMRAFEAVDKGMEPVELQLKHED